MGFPQWTRSREALPQGGVPVAEFGAWLVRALRGSEASQVSAGSRWLWQAHPALPGGLLASMACWAWRPGPWPRPEPGFPGGRLKRQPQRCCVGQSCGMDGTGRSHRVSQTGGDQLGLDFPTRNRSPFGSKACSSCGSWSRWDRRGGWIPRFPFPCPAVWVGGGGRGLSLQGAHTRLPVHISWARTGKWIRPSWLAPPGGGGWQVGGPGCPGSREFGGWAQQRSPLGNAPEAPAA